MLNMQDSWNEFIWTEANVDTIYHLEITNLAQHMLTSDVWQNDNQW